MATIIEVKEDKKCDITHYVEMAQEHVRMAEHLLTEIKEKIEASDK